MIFVSFSLNLPVARLNSAATTSASALVRPLSIASRKEGYVFFQALNSFGLIPKTWLISLSVRPRIATIFTSVR